MLLLFVHGWSVTSTDTYGALPEAVARASRDAGLDVDIQHIHLGQYVSFHDEVVMDDLVRAMDEALRHDLVDNENGKLPFSCITHSTGAPVVRAWLDRYYGNKHLSEAPINHLVMLAPANHGAALAQTGKARVGRIKAFSKGIEPGQGILDWLELASAGQFSLNRAYTDYKLEETGFYPAVITGETIDNMYYDFINNYLTEVGSDGVVRAAAANINHRVVRMIQTKEKMPWGHDDRYKTRRNYSKKYCLQIDKASLSSSPRTAYLVLDYASHTGPRMGIMQSVKETDTDKEVVKAVLKCLRVDSDEAYQSLCNDFELLTSENQARHAKKNQPYKGKTLSRYAQIIFRITDDTGQAVSDFDMLLLATNQYSPDKLPSGFFVDRQRNSISKNHLTYYVDADCLASIKDKQIGIRIIARPHDGFAHYDAVEFHSDMNDISVTELLKPNQTVYVDIIITRQVDRNAMRFGPAIPRYGSFKKIKPVGDNIS